MTKLSFVLLLFLSSASFCQIQLTKLKYDKDTLELAYKEFSGDFNGVVLESKKGVDYFDFETKQQRELRFNNSVSVKGVFAIVGKNAILKDSLSNVYLCTIDKGIVEVIHILFFSRFFSLINGNGLRPNVVILNKNSFYFFENRKVYQVKNGEIVLREEVDSNIIENFEADGDNYVFSLNSSIHSNGIKSIGPANMWQGGYSKFFLFKNRLLLLDRSKNRLFEGKRENGLLRIDTLDLAVPTFYYFKIENDTLFAKFSDEIYFFNGKTFEFLQKKRFNNSIVFKNDSLQILLSQDFRASGWVQVSKKDSSRYTYVSIQDYADNNFLPGWKSNYIFESSSKGDVSLIKCMFFEKLHYLYVDFSKEESMVLMLEVLKPSDANKLFCVSNNAFMPYAQSLIWELDTASLVIKKHSLDPVSIQNVNYEIWFSPQQEGNTIGLESSNGNGILVNKQPWKNDSLIIQTSTVFFDKKVYFANDSLYFLPVDSIFSGSDYAASNNYYIYLGEQNINGLAYLKYFSLITNSYFTVDFNSKFNGFTGEIKQKVIDNTKILFFVGTSVFLWHNGNVKLLKENISTFEKNQFIFNIKNSTTFLVMDVDLLLKTKNFYSFDKVTNSMKLEFSVPYQKIEMFSNFQFTSTWDNHFMITQGAFSKFWKENNGKINEVEIDFDSNASIGFDAQGNYFWDQSEVLPQTYFKSIYSSNNTYHPLAKFEKSQSFFNDFYEITPDKEIYFLSNINNKVILSKYDNNTKTVYQANIDITRETHFINNPSKLVFEGKLAEKSEPYYFTVSEKGLVQLSNISIAQTISPIGDREAIYVYGYIKGGEKQVYKILLEGGEKVAVEWVEYDRSLLPLSFLEEMKALNIYPNPFQESINLDFGEIGFVDYVRLINSTTGQVIYEEDFNFNVLNISTNHEILANKIMQESSKLNSGSFIISMRTEGKLITKRLIKQ